MGGARVQGKQMSKAKCVSLLVDPESALQGFCAGADARTGRVARLLLPSCCPGRLCIVSPLVSCRSCLV